MTKFVNQEKEVRDEFLETCVYQTNISTHESTSFTPFQLTFDRKALLPINNVSHNSNPEVLVECLDEEDAGVMERIMNDHIEKLNQEKLKEQYDRKDV